MASRRDLPPPPERPEVSPPVTVGGEEDITIEPAPESLEARLEAKFRAAHSGERAVLLCHPHPLYGGTMHSAVVLAVAKIIAERAGAVASTLRFNYRGVGASEGRYDEGRGEVLDARAALRELRRRCPRAKITLCGYSFGTWVGLRAAALEGNVERVVLIAPAVRLFTFIEQDAQAFQGRISIAVGDNDEFCDVGEAQALAQSLGASLQVFPGADHYFLRSRRKLAEAVLPLVVPEA